jgi:hypothetical protein
MTTREHWLRFTGLALLSAGMAVGADVAMAEGNPYYLGAAQTMTYNSYMQRYGGVGADWISSTGLRAGVDQSFGREQLVADASANANRYRRNDSLNNTDYALNARLNWASIERLSGLVALQSSQSLYQNNLATNQAFTGRNLVRSNGANFQVQLGAVTVWSFDAGVAFNRQRNSLAAFQSLDLNQTTLSAGTRWAPSSDLSFRVGGRHGKGNSPNYNGGAGDDFTRNDLDFSTAWVVSGASSLNARLSATRLSHSAPGLGNTKGWTGLAGWDWQPTGKLKFGLTASRDTSLGSVDQFGSLVSTNSSNTVLSNSFGLTSNWEATSKILVNARLGYVRRTVDNSVSANLSGLPQQSAVTGKDSITTLSFGLRYLALRNLELGCGYSIEDHRVESGSAALLAPAYNARVYNCYGQAFLR